MTVQTENGVPVLEERAVGLAKRRRREREQTRTALTRSFQHAGIIAIDNRPVLARLIGEDPRLRSRVLLKARVPVQVVGGEVQEDGYVRVEGVGAFQLEAGHLQYERRALRGPFDEARHRLPDVA